MKASIRIPTYLLLVSFLVFAIITACKPASFPGEIGLQLASTTIATMTPTTASTVNPVTPTPPIFTVEEIIETLPDLKQEPTAMPGEPVVLNFPTPLPTDAVDWRPPLYEIPWAPGPNDHFYFMRPIGVNEVNWPQPDYRYGGTFFAPDIVHTGIDIVAKRGTPVLAAASGRVVWAGTGLYFGKYNPDDPYGKSVVIEHEFGYQNQKLFTVYAHLDGISVQLGDEVELSDVIGIVGDTGFTTGPHLHFEVRTGNNNFYRTRNPELWIAPPQGWGIAVARILNAANGPIEKLDIFVTNLATKRTYQVRTYTMSGINSDDYYQENMVLSDLPPGIYEISFDYNDTNYVHQIEIHPGVVTYFSFKPQTGFSDELPNTGSSGWNPIEAVQP
ncbi:MAG: M23 family metallopeptidase [Anaerolineae bacterium]|nr:M23 family metallopeptidase [Anaerolineae bacterium]